MFTSILFLAVLDALKIEALQEYVITQRASEKIQILYWILAIEHKRAELLGQVAPL